MSVQDDIDDILWMLCCFGEVRPSHVVYARQRILDAMLKPSDGVLLAGMKTPKDGHVTLTEESVKMRLSAMIDAIKEGK